MNKIRIIIVFVFTTLVFFSEAQQISDIEAEQLLFDNNIHAAYEAFKTKVQSSPDNPDYLLKFGYCCLSISDKKEKALEYLKKAETLYRAEGRDREAFDAKYQTARAYRKTLQFGDAVVLFNELMIESKRKDYEAVDILQREIEYCENAKRIMNVATPYKLRNPGEPINSSFTEHSPFLSYDESVLIYTSRRKTDKGTQMPDGEYDENIYIAHKDADGFFGTPEPLSDKINTPGNDANCGLSADGSKVYVYRNGDIYESERDGENWTTIVKLGKYVNTSYRELHLFVSKDANTILFTSDMPGGYGETDIYRIDRNGDSWSDPQNLGPSVNTPYKDDSPFLHENGTLYFSSQGHTSIGGFDVFSAEAKGSSFVNTTNLGVPVNSVEDDIHYFLSDDENRAYFCSSRAGGFGRGDIYYIDYTDTLDSYVSVKGQLIYPEGLQPKQAKLTVYEVSSKEKYEELSADTSGSFRIFSKRGDRYFVVAEAEGLFFEVFAYPAPIDNVAEYPLSEKPLYIIDENYVNKKYHIEFVKEETGLSNQSELILNTTVRFLDSQPDLIIDLTGNGKNAQTDRERIMAISQYLKNQGISDARINVGTESFDGQDNKILMTLMDSPMKEYLETGIVADYANNESQDGENANNNYKPIPGGESFFTIKLGTFKEEQKADSDFMRKFKGQVKQTTGSNQEYIYTYGAYNRQSAAEDKLLIIKNMGYPNAEIIEIK